MNKSLECFLNDSSVWFNVCLKEDVFIRSRSSRLHNEIILDCSSNKNIVLTHIKTLCESTAISKNLESTFKYLIIYNADNLTKDNQIILKAIVEKYHVYTRFILTTTKYSLINYRLISLFYVHKLQYKESNNTRIKQEIYKMFENSDDLSKFRNIIYTLLINNIDHSEILEMFWCYFSKKTKCQHSLIHFIADCDKSLLIGERSIYHYDYLYLKVKVLFQNVEHKMN